MKRALIQCLAVACISPVSIASTPTKVPHSIDGFAVKVATGALSFVEKSRINDDGDYVVTVIVSDKECTVTVESIEVEHRTLDGDLLEPLHRPVAKSIDCKPRFKG